MDNSVMSIYQVLTSESSPGDARYELVPNDREIAPEAFEELGRNPAYFGTEDIIRLAIALEAADYMPVEVAFSDSYRERLSAEETQLESKTLIASLKHRDPKASLKLLASQFKGLLVESLRMRGQKGRRGASLRLLQDGVVVVSAGPLGNEPEEDLQRALNVSD